MGDAGEGLIDADSRIQERMEELARERAERSAGVTVDPQAVRAVESLKLAKVDLERQMNETTHEGRRKMLKQAIAEIDSRIAGASGTSGATTQAAPVRQTKK